MIKRFNAPAAVLLGLGTLMSTLAGCASDGAFGTSANMTTSAVTPVAAPKVDPACVTLAAQIDSLRQEGTIDRLQKASEGKTASVQVKRASLAKQAELNKANADFQAKCATITPKPSNAAMPAAVAKEAAAVTAPAAVKTAALAAPAAAAAKKVVKKTATVSAVKPAVTAASPVPASPVVTTSSRAPDVVVSTIPPQQ